MDAHFRENDQVAADAPLQYQGHGVRLQRATESVNGTFMRGYLEMICVVGEQAQHMFHWAESCPCHGSLGFGDAGNWATARALFAARFAAPGAPRRCPVVGCRVPEVCCGDSHDMVGSIQALSQAQLLIKLSHVSSTDRALIVADFGRIK